MTADLDSLAGQIHDILRMAPGSSSAHRALHAKGVVATGTFTASGELDGLTTAPHLTAGATPAIARFSHPGGDPNVSDVIPSGRGLAVKLTTPAGSHQIVTVTSPAFLVRDGASFLELLLARAPDPDTGAPNPDAMGAFIAAHPESLPAIEAALTARVPASYATLAYHSLHTFFLVDTGGARRPVRFTWSPGAGPGFLDDADGRGGDFLATELAERLERGPIGFDLVAQFGAADDPTDDPTAIWPDRPTRTVGRLELDAIDSDAEPVIFDANNVVDGIALPEGDEILALRRAVYSRSYAHRTG